MYSRNKFIGSTGIIIQLSMIKSHFIDHEVQIINQIVHISDRAYRLGYTSYSKSVNYKNICTK